MREYELVLVLKSSLSNPQRKKLMDTIKTWIGDAKITKEEEWGQKNLSYLIKKEALGFYINLMLESENGLSNDMEKKLLANDDVLRHLLLRI